ncbi:hypothetical protein BCR43DRAFT_498013 [Syncephalastrum racemosum]|uniref:Uncharacterized protein n=1 Tax=Syncephalastrum racemosum TaxID=13706 RepID=A0A1X2H3E3_SYNRA|nr:hypothetical protein BCR43DRAFT_498013 [Syncephalastrum racemosum]
MDRNNSSSKHVSSKTTSHTTRHLKPTPMATAVVTKTPRASSYNEASFPSSATPLNTPSPTQPTIIGADSTAVLSYLPPFTPNPDFTSTLPSSSPVVSPHRAPAALIGGLIGGLTGLILLCLGTVVFIYKRARGAHHRRRMQNDDDWPTAPSSVREPPPAYYTTPKGTKRLTADTLVDSTHNNRSSLSSSLMASANKQQYAPQLAYSPSFASFARHHEDDGVSPSNTLIDNAGYLTHTSKDDEKGSQRRTYKPQLLGDDDRLTEDYQDYYRHRLSPTPDQDHRRLDQQRQEDEYHEEQVDPSRRR